MAYQKTLKLEISEPAKDDLRDIAQYTFAGYGERQMDIYLQSLYDGMELLAENPEIGHHRNDLPEGYEAMNVGKHVLIFTIRDNAIVIARIFHQSRDMKRDL
jgi:toxin ParE1/3/4